MRKWMRKIGALAISLALVLAIAGCGVDVGIIGGEDGPTKIITGTDAGQLEDTASVQEALSEGPESDSGPGIAAGEDIDSVSDSSAAGEGEDHASDPDSVASEKEQLIEDEPPADGGAAIDEAGTYNSAEDVSLYLYTFGHLPENYITKNKARNLGWTGGSVERYAPGCAIGGDTFGNREGVLPDGKYHECDVDTIGKNSRGAKRLIYSDDGRIYYTEDHYETFILLYGEEST